MQVIKQTKFDEVNQEPKAYKVQSESKLYGLDFQPTLYDKFRAIEWGKDEPHGIELIENLWDCPDDGTELFV